MPSALKKGRGCASNGGKGAMDDGKAEYDDVEWRDVQDSNDVGESVEDE
jgi:hypothetical protein